MTVPVLLLGSPPRMRGKPSWAENKWIVIGITPAHAGKTWHQPRPYSAYQDHPRACGENKETTTEKTALLGSPPRMRGKRRRNAQLCAAGRITPAHAGKTLRKWRISVVDPSPQPRSSLTSRRADASIGSQRAPCAAPV